MSHVNVVHILRDGQLAHTCLAVNDPTDDAEISRGVARVGLGEVRWIRSIDLQLPDGDEYFDALCWRDGAVGHDMAKARSIHRERIRRRRAKLFEQLDNERRDAEDSEDTQAIRKVRQKRQKLKDAPADPRIDACSTVEELRALNVLDRLEDD